MTKETFGPQHFVNFLQKGDGILDSLEEKSLARDVPIIGPSLGKLLYILVKSCRARNILELGTANGYSAIWMARALQNEGRITSIEWDGDMVTEARKNITDAGLAEIVDVIQGDAIVWLDEASGDYDLIFMDIEKELYSPALANCARLLRPGGMLVCDNVAFKTAGNFNRELFDNPMLETSFVYGVFHNHAPDEDAISMSIRRL